MNHERGNHKRGNEPQLDRLSTPNSRRLHILLVDDEPSILSSLATVLLYNRPDYNIEIASSAEEALSVFERIEIDLLITDLKLPEMDGLSLVRTALRKNPDTRSILMTAFGTDWVDYDAYRNGCISYLEKPFNVDHLLQSIDESLAQARERRKGPSKTFTDAIRRAGEQNKELSLRVSDGFATGLILFRDNLIQYADFNGLVGITALVAMIACKDPQIESTEGAPDISHGDLPVEWTTLIEAATIPSMAQQIAILRQNNRELRMDIDTDDIEVSEELEKLIQCDMLAEIVQRLRESKEDAAFGGKLKRKRLHFHQTLSIESLERQVRLRKLVNSGAEYFSDQNFEEARRCWQDALTLDPNCQPAKQNLALLADVIWG